MGGVLFRIRNLLSRSQFLKHVSIMAIGSALAQIITLLSLPLLSRLFQPSEFGVLTVYASATGVLAIFATGRFELAIVLAKDDETAEDVAAVGFVLSTIVATALFLVVPLWLPNFITTFAKSDIRSWLWAIPISTWLIATFLIFSYRLVRLKDYRSVALNGTIQQLGIASWRAIFGTVITAPLGNGLIAGTLVGQLLSTASLANAVRRMGLRVIPRFSPSRMIIALRAYRKFLLFNMPYSAVGLFSRDFIIYILSFFSFTSAAGQFGLSRSIMLAPSVLLSSSLGQVFYQKAAASLGRPEVELLALRFCQILVKCAVPVITCFAFWAPTIFTLVFGAQWREAGVYTAIYSPVLFCTLFTSWTDRIYEVTQKQQISFSIQVIADSINIIVTTLVILLAKDPFYGILVYSVCAVVYHLIYFVTLFRAAEFDSARFRPLVAEVAMLALASFAVFFGIAYLPVSTMFQLSLSALALTGYLVYALTKIYHLAKNDLG